MGSTGGSSGTGGGALDGDLDFVNDPFTLDARLRERSLTSDHIFFLEVEDTVEGKEQADFVEMRRVGAILTS